MKQCRNLRTKYSKILKRDGLFSVSKVISKVYANNKKRNTPFGVFLFLSAPADLNHLNADVQ